ncbi:gluconeogenesis factor YvcK family protein [Clostridium sp. UBA4548]|uniref:gluconeogenesis factor YvcK family protein n=1 Tax=Clostridium sp. UBA4548 TaxID=1946361 RepID=UPI0025BD56D4|nr:gluconeogenesis factor YvcK family protein [Clostridium sp. UBA4548]
MKLRYWLRPGIGIKRWLAKSVFGIALIVYAVMELINKFYFGLDYILFWILIIFIGVFAVYYGFSNYTERMFALLNLEVVNLSLSKKNIGELIYEKKILVKGPKIVVIGGGTGLSNMLSGLKKFTSNITAIVTVADDGGGSGVLRQDLGILPPGDIRNCIIALADTEPIMEDLFRYRFKDGRLENQNFGNLFLAAMDGISDNFLEAIKKTCSVLAVTGRVLPVTLENLQLFARLKNGSLVRGESVIPIEAVRRNSPIESVFIEPKEAKAVEEAITAILEADAVILGPGSLYTSIIPNLLVRDIKEALNDTRGIKIYVSNIMTQPGETDNFTVQDHIKAIHDHCGSIIIDYAIVNGENIGEDLKKKYLEEGSIPVVLEKSKSDNLDVEYIKANIVRIKNGYVRHNEDKLAEILVETVMRKKLFYDEKRILEFFYLSQKLKEAKRNRE